MGSKAQVVDLEARVVGLKALLGDLEGLSDCKGDFINLLVAESDHFEKERDYYKAKCEEAGIL
jgi:hypothetical protein